MFDIILSAGTILDGDGAAPQVADVGLRGDRIAAVGDLAGAPAGRTLDASRLTVAPGFIDVHNHSEGWLLREPSFEAKLSQGFTTEILMSDGISYAPLTPELAPDWFSYLRALNGLTLADYRNWRTLGDYLRLLDGRTAQNAAALVPYANVRVLAAGWGRGPLNAEQMRQVHRHVEQGLADGAVGLSTGLDYISQCFASTDELVDALRPLGGGKRPYVTHVRYKLGVVEGVREAVEIGRRARVPVHISHLKGASAAEADALLDYIDRAAVHEVDFSFDVYPYMPGSTLLASLLPYEAWEDGPLAAAGKLVRPEIRQQFAALLEEHRASLAHVRVAWLPSRENQPLLGLSLLEVAQRRGRPAAEALADLLLDEGLAVLCVFHYGRDKSDVGDDPAAAARRRERMVEPFLAHPRFMLGSDGIFQPDGPVHPRVFGSAPRLLALARTGRIGSLAEVVQKMTSVPADRFGLVDRGRIRPGALADLTVFDADAVQDMATFDQPRQFSRGIRYVLVNGQLAWSDGFETENASDPLLGRACRFGA